MNFEDFLRVQNKSYEDFERFAEKTKEVGIRVDPYFKQYSGFYVNLTHSAEAARRAAEFSRGLGALIASTVYNEGDVHTTLASMAALKFQVDPYEAKHVAIMDELAAVAREAVSDLHGRIAIDYDRYLHTDVVAIAAGMPNEAFVELFSAIIRGAKRRGMDLKPPWAANITLARFTGAFPADGLGQFFRFFKTAGVPGRSIPTRLNVGYNSWHFGDSRAARGGHFVPYVSIPLGE